LRGGYLGFGLEGQSSGSVPSFICANADFGFCSGYTRYVSRLAPRIVFSAQAGYDITQQISLAVSVNNLLDKRYYTSVGLRNGGNWYGQPRNVLVSLRGAF
jgi:outer membrane receptor for ferric coprogen and ferric-rhodotorulic acid